jgi:hypothetical protein
MADARIADTLLGNDALQVAAELAVVPARGLQLMIWPGPSSDTISSCTTVPNGTPTAEILMVTAAAVLIVTSGVRNCRCGGCGTVTAFTLTMVTAGVGNGGAIRGRTVTTPALVGI